MVSISTPILVLGANGYIGRHIVTALKKAGFQHVVGLVRDGDAKVFAAKESGCDEVSTIRDFSDLDQLEQIARKFAVCINTATATGNPQADEALNQVMLNSVQSLFLYTSGCLTCGNQDFWEDEDAAPLSPLSAWRVKVEQQVLQAGNSALRTAVVRPGFVYGGGLHGDGGSDYLVKHFFDTSLSLGSAEVYGAGQNRLPLVHVDDLAQLYVQLLQSDAGVGGVYHAAHSHDGVLTSVAETAKACSRASGNGSIIHIEMDDVRQRMGAFANAFTLDQKFGCPKSNALGWSAREFDANDAYQEYLQCVAANTKSRI